MLTIQFVPYVEIENLNSDERIDKLLKIVQDEKIIVLAGRLKPVEETGLIHKTMELIDKNFRGIEISSINPESKNNKLINKIRNKFINIISGDRSGMTIIGPANIIKEIKQDPEKIQLLMSK